MNIEKHNVNYVLSHEDTTKELLEKMIDHYQAHEILEMFSEICIEKAEHVRTTWQDENLALAWETLEKKVIAAANTATRVLP